MAAFFLPWEEKALFVVHNVWNRRADFAARNLRIVESNNSRRRIYPSGRLWYGVQRLVKGEPRVKGLGKSARAVLTVALCLCVAAMSAGCAAMKSKTGSTKNRTGVTLASGDAAWASGDVQTAGRLYTQALEEGADPAKGHTRLGDLYLSHNVADKALAEYKLALAADPKYAPAIQGFGFAQYLSGNTDGAVASLQQALALDPGLTRAAALLGTIENRQGHPEAALAVFDKSLAVTFDPDVENNRGLSLMLLGRFEEAAASFHRALGAKKIPKIANNLGLALCRLKRYDEAYATFASVGSQAAALNNIGVCYMEAGDKVRAQEYFERAIAANPSYYAKAQTNLSRLSAAETVNLPSAAVPASAPPPAPVAATPSVVDIAPPSARPVGVMVKTPAPAPLPPVKTSGAGTSEKTDRAEMP